MKEKNTKEGIKERLTVAQTNIKEIKLYDKKY